jgi:hypothetical protein
MQYLLDLRRREFGIESVGGQLEKVVWQFLWDPEAVLVDSPRYGNVGTSEIQVPDFQLSQA